MKTAALVVSNLTVLYGNQPALWDVSFALPRGKLVGIIGPNGAGKSTLIKSMLGLVRRQSGNVQLLGGSVKASLSQVAYVPQRETVDWNFPISVYEVVMMGRYGKLGLFRRPRKRDKAIVHTCLEQVGMQSFARRQIAQLSGGQQQRVFLARSLAQEAALYLMDEPFAGIDIHTENLMFELLKMLTGAGKTVVIVFHNIYQASSYFEWLILLNRRLIACGETQAVFTQKNITETYGGALGILSQVEQMAQPAHFHKP